MYAIDGSRRLRAPLSISSLTDLTLVWIGAILVVTFFVFSLKAGDWLSRGALLSFLVVGYLAIVATRATVPSLIRTYCRPARFSSPKALVIGSDSDSALDRVVSELRGVGLPNPSVARVRTKCSVEEWRASLPATTAQIHALARTTKDGDICIAAGSLSDAQLRDIIGLLELIPRAVCVIPPPAVERLLHLPKRYVGELYSLEIQRAPMSSAQRIGKRAMDLLICIPLLFFIAPPLIAVAIAVKLDSRGPVLFRQKRLGYRGKPFSIMKFRTMTVLEDGDDVRHAERGDIRITRLGRLLRFTSIDELPQLINVVRGEMSLVGPRPHAVAHDLLYSKLVDHYDIRQHVKPGITGWAQVNGSRGGGETEIMRARLAFDLHYAKNASLLFDVKILMLTAVEIIRRRNAY